MIWISSCRIDDHYLIWSFWVSRTCKQYFSIQNFVPLLLWLLQGLPLRPTLWSSQLRWTWTSFVSFPMVRDPWFWFPIVRMAKERKLSLSFLRGLVEHFCTFGNYHTSSQNRLRLAASSARSSLPSWSSWQGTLPPYGLRRFPRVLLPGRIWLLPLTYILNMVGSSPFCKTRHLVL